MKNRKISLFFILGIGLVLIGLCLVVVFRIRVHIVCRDSQTVAAQMQQLLPERTTGTPGMYLDSSMPILEIGGKDYVGLLEIPAFGIILPVGDQWDSKKMADIPARFCGSAYDGTLVIGGADYPQQFAFCDQIENGTHVTVTDMTGAEFTYTVCAVHRSKHAEAQWLQSAEYDLTLFCRDMYSMEYVAVRCVSAFG